MAKQNIDKPSRGEGDWFDDYLEDGFDDEYDEAWGELDAPRPNSKPSNEPLQDIHTIYVSTLKNESKDLTLPVQPSQDEIAILCDKIKRNMFTELTPYPFIKDIVVAWFQHDFLKAINLYFLKPTYTYRGGYLTEGITTEEVHYDGDLDCDGRYYCKHQKITLKEIIDQWPIGPSTIAKSWFCEYHGDGTILKPLSTIGENINHIGDILDFANLNTNYIFELLSLVDTNTLGEIRSMTKMLPKIFKEAINIPSLSAFSATSLYRFNKTLDEVYQSRGRMERTKSLLRTLFFVFRY